MRPKKGLEAPRGQRSLLSMQTFHSFFWDILRTNAYLLGVPKRLQILLPQDERALSGGIDDSDPEWPAWVIERERLFREEGKIAFDLFTSNAAALLEHSKHLLRLVAQRHPLIVVDEAQDTGQHAWHCAELLAAHTQLICLADLEQQIFDYLPGVGPERVTAIRAVLNPLDIDLGSQNYRSPDSEILAFGNDILTGNARGSPYQGVSRLSCNPKTHVWNKTLRKALAVLHRHVRAETGRSALRVAVLVPNNRNALRISTALNALDGTAGKPVKHKLLFDEAEAMLSARFAAFLLEPKKEQDILQYVARGHELIADAKNATGQGKARVQELQVHAARIRAGKIPKTNLVKLLQGVIETLRADGFTGDPVKDWSSVKRALWSTGQADLHNVMVIGWPLTVAAGMLPRNKKGGPKGIGPP